MSLPVFPLRAAAALFIERQQLDRPRGRRLTARTLTEFAEATGGIQLDTISVVERAHHLTLWSRFGPYDRRRLERLIYKERRLFEYWAHVACLVPTSHFASWRRVMLDARERRRGAWGPWLRKNRPLIGSVIEALERDGPIGSSYFEHRRPPGREKGWWNWKPATFALEHLWFAGIALVHSRVHFQKRYAMADRVIPGAESVPAPSTEDFRRWHIRQSLRAMGAATELDLRMYLVIPRMPSTERRAVLERMIADGEVVEVALDGASGARARKAPRWVALAEDLPALERAARARRPARGTALLSPFDSFLWHRDRVSLLFGYDYRIEVYVPGHKRVHGYYSLPIYHDGHLIGRLDPKTHRAERRLEVKSVHFEPWFVAGRKPPAASWGTVDRDDALAGVAEALRSIASFVGAEDITVGRVGPSKLTAPLKRALAAARPRAAQEVADEDAAEEPVPAGGDGGMEG